LHPLTTEKAIIVDLSFGGMLATEMAKHPGTKVIITSSKLTSKFHYTFVLAACSCYKFHSNRTKNYAGQFVLSILKYKAQNKEITAKY